MDLNINLDFDEIISNKYTIGILMILINIGSRFIIDELTPNQKKFINKKYIRRIFIFCIFLMATKDILASITLTFIFIIFISELFITNNENIIDDNENDDIKRKKILDEISLILSKYSM